MPLEQRLLRTEVDVRAGRDGGVRHQPFGDVLLGHHTHVDLALVLFAEPGLVKPGMLKEGVVLIDAGTSEQGGKLAGDADPSCAGACSVFTPVPGGVGPIAVAMIFKNLSKLAKLPKK